MNVLFDRSFLLDHKNFIITVTYIDLYIVIGHRIFSQNLLQNHPNLL